jgi:hypothetical protein
MTAAMATPAIDRIPIMAFLLVPRSADAPFWVLTSATDNDPTPSVGGAAVGGSVVKTIGSSSAAGETDGEEEIFGVEGGEGTYIDMDMDMDRLKSPKYISSRRALLSKDIVCREGQVHTSIQNHAHPVESMPVLTLGHHR